ncbi:MAG TPA: SLBB domain-containing protein [Draconibacterium sp.]|nr:SLBB domain-containing protein [Draconibacterium sp.]
MRFKLKFIILLSIIFIANSIAVAQEVQGVDVKALPQSEIQKAQKAMQDAGLSTQDAANIARQKGATEQQIQDFENRLQDGNTPAANEISDPVQDASENVEEQQDIEKSKRQSGYEANGRIFGSYLFNNRNLTFNPSINIQTPKNYEIGIGDQIIVNIWGNSQNNYQLQVNKNGQILIPDVGPVYIAGNTFQEAENKIIQRLTSIYADMGGSNPQTFAQVNMGQLRSIQVNLVGEVAAPGTYTLPVTATVFNGLYLSGGPNNIGSFRNIKIIRNNKVFKTIDIYKFLVNADPSENILLNDDDIIFIPAAEKRVEVNGEFKRNGLFELKEDEMLSDLIRFAGGFTENSYLSKTQIYRKTQQGYQISDVAFSQLATTQLINGDEIRNKQILSSFENRVTISGSVYRPGDYEWSPGLTLKQLILKADSIMPDAFLKRGIITRYNPDLTTSAISFNLEDILTGNSNIALFPEDMVLIKSHFQLKEQSYITVNGEVLAPGKFNWSDELTLGDAIFLAGGFTEGADSTFIEVARRLSYEETAELTDKLVHTEILNLSRDLSLNSNDAGFLLKPYDQISVRQAPGFRQDKTVFISGEVAYAGAYAVSDKKQRISDLIQMAGGLTPQAFIEGATLQRFSNELGSEQVAIDLKLVMNNPGSETDFFLNNGDRIYIPEYLPTVKITGSVQNPFSIAFESGKTAKYYIDRSGGFNFDAHKKKTYVRYANGTTAVTKSFLIKNYPEVQPGSQIIVPQKPEKKATDSGKWIAWASVLSSLAVSAATIYNITK